MKSRAFTLIELLVVISVIAVLAAILVPAIANSKMEAKITRSESNLHQFALALSIYQANQGDTSGNLRGFPPSMGVLARQGLVSWDLFKTGGSPLGNLPPIYCFRIPNVPDSATNPNDWWQEYDTYQDQAVFGVDGTFRNSRFALQEPYSRHFALGGHLDGHVERRWNIGDFTQAAFWH